MVTLAERFWQKVDASGDCWLWTGAKNDMGYGQFGIDGKMRYVHRAAYPGVIPDGYDVDHLCRVPACLNPAHLQAVPHRENVRRGHGLSAKRARMTHCVNGHPLGPDGDVYIRASGGRMCKVCRRERARRYYHEAKQ